MRCIGHVWGSRYTELPHHLQVYHSPNTSVWSGTWKLPEPLRLGFLWKLHDITQLIKSLTISDPSTQPPAPLPFLEVRGGAESSNPLTTWWLQIVPHPQRQSKSHLININSGVVERGSFHLYHSTPNNITKDARASYHLGALLPLRKLPGF